MQEISLLQERVAAVAVDNKVILTQTSCGYLEFAVNWITHVEALGLTNWLTIAEDETALKFLEERYPGHALPASAFTNEALSSGNALYEWGSAAFTKVACARPSYLQVSASPPAAHPMCIKFGDSSSKRRLYHRPAKHPN